MLKTHSEKNDLPFNGTIIDFETIGNFCDDYCNEDSRRYKNITLTMFGYIDGDNLNMLCAEGVESLKELKIKTIQILPTLKRPLFAFKSCFEKGVLFHSCGVTTEFDGELNAYRREWKGNACAELDISNYNDPFDNDGGKCKLAWLRGDYENAIQHNRSCLLKERDILLKRGCRKPDILNLCSD